MLDIVGQLGPLRFDQLGRYAFDENEVHDAINIFGVVALLDDWGHLLATVDFPSVEFAGFGEAGHEDDNARHRDASYRIAGLAHQSNLLQPPPVPT